MGKEKICLSGVNETMLVPVVARALESKKKNPAFYDETAVRVVDFLEYDFQKHEKNKFNMWGCSARTIILDQQARAYIKTHPNCSVVNMACGLDDRFSRVDNGTIEWYNIDFENIMEIREKIILPNKRVVNISLSVLAFSWGVEAAEDFTKLCPVYKMTEDFNITDTMKRFSPVFMSLVSPFLRKKNNRIACFEKIS